MLFFLYFFHFFIFFFSPIAVEGGGGDCKGGGKGRCSWRSGTGGDCCSYWLEPEEVVLLSPCDTYRMFQSERMLVVIPTNVLKIQY